MILERRDRSFNEGRVVANDLDEAPRRQCRLELPDLRFHALDKRQRIGPKLPLDAEHDRLCAVDPLPGRALWITVLHTAYIFEANRRAVDVGDDDVVELTWRLDAAQRPHAQLGIALANGSAGHLHVFVLERLLHLLDRDAKAAQLLRVGKHADLAQA